ncbi:MAG: hypothetical protein QOF89_2728 [Acidobacteriota bacterium]|jgi:hypothetical protein|nr:hypothetical protein [Acidobacteriota bacterium]
MKRSLLTAISAVALVVLLVAPAFAAERVIYNGIDLWQTKGNGSTFRDFSKAPIPAGFFCAKSAPFIGKIIFRGIPVATNGSLGVTDTIVQRLDDAVFNENGTAVTRLQVRALSFEGTAPIKTSCGPFKVRVTLDGEQPVTQMRIIRNDENGGHFLSPIWVNVKMIFTPVSGPSREPLELSRKLRFAADPKAAWSDKPELLNKRAASVVKVDTDGDRVPDTFLPGPSNFIAGLRTPAGKAISSKMVSDPTCHCDASCYYQHCTYMAVQPAQE